MKYHETGRFGRITKSIRNAGQTEKLVDIMPESQTFSRMSPKEKAEYIQLVTKRMEDHLGYEQTKAVLRCCGAQCSGKSWKNFVRDTWKDAQDTSDFFKLLNIREREYQTIFSYSSEDNTVEICRTRCVCGLVANARYPFESNAYCQCSTGHFQEFFSAVFLVEDICLLQSILGGADSCRWIVTLRPTGKDDRS